MAAETDRKTKLGLLEATKKVEQVDATLTEISPESDEYRRALNRSRGLSKALLAALYDLMEAGILIGRGKAPRQLSIPNLLQAVRQGMGIDDEGAQEAVEEVATQSDAITEDGDDGTPPERCPKKTGPVQTVLDTPDEDDEVDGSAENIRRFLADEETTVAALEEQGRVVHLRTVSGWSRDDRRAALAWASEKATGGDPELPACLERRYLEDLDLTRLEDLQVLLGWVAAPVPTEGEVDSGVIGALALWAAAAHRVDRGEAGVEVPNLPEEFLPDPEIFEAIFEYVGEQDEPVVLTALVDHFQAQDFGAGLAVRAMIEAADILHTADGVVQGERGGELGVDAMSQLAADIANRVERAAVDGSEDEEPGDVQTPAPTAETEDEEPDLPRNTLVTAGSAAERDPRTVDANAAAAAQGAFGEGYAAQGAGKRETDNPYDPEASVDDHLAWADGWKRSAGDAALEAEGMDPIEPKTDDPSDEDDDGEPHDEADEAPDDDTEPMEVEQ